MAQPIRILLQTTIPTAADDWSIDRFSLLSNYLASLHDEAGAPLFQVTARDRDANAEGHDRVLSRLDRSEFDELWLFAVDTGEGLTDQDCAGITAFRQQGGGILATRDHQDLGSSLSYLTGACHPLGSAHFFHSVNPDPDLERHCRDDIETQSITWPNYHSGRNGDYQTIQRMDPLHEVLRRPSGDPIQFFPAHPHEGAVGLRESDPSARVIATGTSLVSGRSFNLAVAFEQTQDQNGHTLGRAVAQSTFHHFVDYNWDPGMGAPSFVEEPPGDGMIREPQALADIKTYVRNLAQWLALHNN